MNIDYGLTPIHLRNICITMRENSVFLFFGYFSTEYGTKINYKNNEDCKCYKQIERNTSQKNISIHLVIFLLWNANEYFR